MSTEAVRLVAIGSLCWTLGMAAQGQDLIAPEAQAEQQEVEDSTALQGTSNDRLSRVATAATRVLLLGACLATFGKAMVGPEFVEGAVGLDNPCEMLVRNSPEGPYDGPAIYVAQPLTPFKVGGAFSRFEYVVSAEDERVRHPSSGTSYYHSSSASGPLFRREF